MRTVSLWSRLAGGARLAAPLVLLAALGLPACGDDGAGVSCGEGTVERDGQCVADNVPEDRRRQLPDAGPDAGADGASAPDTGADVASSSDLGAPDTGDDEPRNDGTCTVESGVIGFWDGTWSGHVWGSHPLAGGDFDQAAFGDLTFEVYCEASKLLIEGEMSGMANGTFPFQGDLVGEFNTETSAVDMDLVNASVNMLVINVQFIADLTGDLVGTSFENGLWSGESTNPTGAFGEGDWQATHR